MSEMKKLDGIHHISSITADAPGNLAFYAGVLGLRLVKKTVNQDDPTVYHLFYADENASAGADMTFFEYPGVPRGRAGAGMIHRITFRVGSEKALDFWQARLAAHEVDSERADGRLRFTDPEGLGLELLVDDATDAPLIAEHPEVPAQHALQGFAGVRAYASAPERSQSLLENTLGFQSTGPGQFESRGEIRRSFYGYDPAPAARGLSGAGTVHHVAWSSTLDDHAAWRERVMAAGARPTPIIDRYYFKSIYFREPSGVLFEIATLGPGFTTDEPLEHLGERISLPPAFEHLRDEVERTLTPLPNPRAKSGATAKA
ncbi:MAG TPA: VOC family protein [Candidatus Micrarchaeaceae archaeon]|nr:VOC family protein [Candidatus Micrarchaeaceae archaeon]